MSESKRRDWLKSRRKSLGLSQQDVADYVGMDVASYSQIECGRRNPSREKADKLAEVLLCSVDYVYDGISTNVDATKEENRELRTALEAIAKIIADILSTQ